jgi:hypothetical protein
MATMKGAAFDFGSALKFAFATSFSDLSFIQETL